MSEMKKRISRSRSCRAPQRKDPAAQYRGALNKALGARFEDRIAESLLFYERSGEAAVEKTPEPMHPTRTLATESLLPTMRSPHSPTIRASCRVDGQ